MKDSTKYLVHETNNLIKEISFYFQKSAINFFRLGIKEFYNIQKNELPNHQTAVANLCISIELLFKSIIAKKSIRDLYKNLPQEFQIYLSNSELLPDYSTFRKFSIDLKGSTYKTIEFNECISLFYLFYQKEKQKYRPYLSLLANVRNTSIHSYLPKFQLYELSKVAYISIELFYLIIGEIDLNIDAKVKATNAKFLKSYDSNRVEKVRMAIEVARVKAKKINHSGSMISVRDWNAFVGICPICDSDVTLNGYTDAHFDGEDSYLLFYADSFECEDCGLKLDDFEELKLAGMQLVYDRSESISEYWNDLPSI